MDRGIILIIPACIQLLIRLIEIASRFENGAEGIKENPHWECSKSNGNNVEENAKNLTSEGEITHGPLSRQENRNVVECMGHCVEGRVFSTNAIWCPLRFA